MEFTIDQVFEALKGPLAVIDNPERRKQIEDYIDATRVQLERSVFDLLSQFAEAVNREAGEHYEAVLSYRPGMLDLQMRRKESAAGAEEPLLSFSEGDVEKITLRIPAELKDMAVEAATKAGLSSNSWFVRMLARSVRQSEGFEPPREEPPGRRERRGRHGGTGSRITGWVGPEEGTEF